MSSRFECKEVSNLVVATRVVKWWSVWAFNRGGVPKGVVSILSLLTALLYAHTIKETVHPIGRDSPGHSGEFVALLVRLWA